MGLGDRRHTVCVLDADGWIATEETITNTRECLTGFGARFRGATIGAAAMRSNQGARAGSDWLPKTPPAMHAAARSAQSF